MIDDHLVHLPTDGACIALESVPGYYLHTKRGKVYYDKAKHFGPKNTFRYIEIANEGPDHAVCQLVCTDGVLIVQKKKVVVTDRVTFNEKAPHKPENWGTFHIARVGPGEFAFYSLKKSSPFYLGHDGKHPAVDSLCATCSMFRLVTAPQVPITDVHGKRAKTRPST
ncbi:hypothetical protein KIPB_000782, partial [Kipferlia bialata]|eukprot:g782.t1